MLLREGPEELFLECGYNAVAPQRYLRRIIHNQIDVEHGVLCRCSSPEVFFKKGVFKNFTKFTGKDLQQSLFLSKVASLKKENLPQEIFNNIFFIEQLQWLQHCDCLVEANKLTGKIYQSSFKKRKFVVSRINLFAIKELDFLKVFIFLRCIFSDKTQ